MLPVKRLGDCWLSLGIGCAYFPTSLEMTYCASWCLRAGQQGKLAELRLWVLETSSAVRWAGAGHAEDGDCFGVLLVCLSSDSLP